MPLYYRLGDPKDPSLKTVRINNTAEVKSMNSYGSDCISLQANGDELNAIKDQFSNIPMTKHAAVRWTGNLAAFIAVNLDPSSV